VQFKELPLLPLSRLGTCGLRIVEFTRFLVRF